MLNGSEELCGASIIFGADGCVPGLANFFPELFIKLFIAGSKGEINEVYDIQKQIWEIRKVFSCVRSWMAAIKYIASMFDFGTETVSAPIQPLCRKEKDRVNLILKKYLKNIN